MLTSAVLADLNTLLAPVDQAPSFRDETHDLGFTDLGDMWIDLGGGD